MSRWPLVAVFGLVAAAPARADLPPPLPFTSYRVPTYRIETREDVREYVFLLSRHNFGFMERPDQPFEFVTPEGSDPAALTLRGKPRERAELSVVPKAVAERYATAKELADAIESGRVLRVAHHVFIFRETVPSWSPNPVVTHELRRAGDDALVVVRTSRDPMWQWYAAAVPFTLAILFGGFWLVRRRGAMKLLGAILLALLFLALCATLFARG